MGYEDFFKLPWLRTVLSWQDDSGCFTGEEHRPHADEIEKGKLKKKKLRHSVPGSFTSGDRELKVLVNAYVGLSSFCLKTFTFSVNTTCCQTQPLSSKTCCCVRANKYSQLQQNEGRYNRLVIHIGKKNSIWTGYLNLKAVDTIGNYSK